MSAELSAKMKNLRKFESTREANLVQWQSLDENRPERRVGSMDNLPVWSRDGGVFAEPVGPVGPDAVPWEPFSFGCRASSLAETFLKRAPHASRTRLLEEWDALHERYLQDDTPDLGSVQPRRPAKLCHHAGMCLCSHSTLVRFVDSLKTSLRKLCPARSYLRDLWSQGMLVFQLKPGGPCARKIWLYPAFVNLTTFNTVLLPLVEDDDPVRVLEAHSDSSTPLKLARPDHRVLGAATWWQFCSAFETRLSEQWSLSCFSLSSSCATVTEFIPANLFVQGFDETVVFWSGPHAKQPKQKRSKPTKKQAPHQLAFGHVPGEGDGDQNEGNDVAEGPAMSDDAATEIEGDAFAAGDDEVVSEEEPYWRADVGAALLEAGADGEDSDRGSEIDGGQGVDLDDVEDDGGRVEPRRRRSDGDIVSPAPSDGRVVVDGGGGAAGSDDVPPPPEPPAPAAVGAADVDMGHVPRNARRPDFPQAVHPSWNGYLKLSNKIGKDYKALGHQLSRRLLCLGPRGNLLCFARTTLPYFLLPQETQAK